MEILFLLLVSSSLVWVVYGLISPENALPFLKNPSRLKVLGIFFVAAIILGNLIAPKTKSNLLPPYNEINKILDKMNTSTYSDNYDPDLNGEEGSDSLAWRFKTDRGTVIAYAKDNNLICLRWAGKDIYRNGKIILNISDYELTHSELKNIQNNIENAIKSNLNDPSSAEFANINEWQYEKTPEKIFVTGWLRANNAYGAKIKKNFTAELSPKGNTIRTIKLN